MRSVVVAVFVGICFLVVAASTVLARNGPGHMVSAAIDGAYLNDALKGGTSKEDAVVAPEDYRTKAKDVAERQIVFSGYRLSDAMVEVFGE
jgi:pyruvoyl-dependent arginine decarboxylase (PvlArgDC)